MIFIDFLKMIFIDFDIFLKISIDFYRVCKYIDDFYFKRLL